MLDEPPAGGLRPAVDGSAPRCRWSERNCAGSSRSRAPWPWPADSSPPTRSPPGSATASTARRRRSRGSRPRRSRYSSLMRSVRADHAVGEHQGANGVRIGYAAIPGQAAELIAGCHLRADERPPESVGHAGKGFERSSGSLSEGWARETHTARRGGQKRRGTGRQKINNNNNASPSSARNAARRDAGCDMPTDTGRRKRGPSVLFRCGTPKVCASLAVFKARMPSPPAPPSAP